MTPAHQCELLHLVDALKDHLNHKTTDDLSRAALNATLARAMRLLREIERDYHLNQDPLPGYPSHAEVQYFMHESGFNVPHPDDQPVKPDCTFMKFAARIADQQLERCYEKISLLNGSEQGKLLIRNLQFSLRPKGDAFLNDEG